MIVLCLSIYTQRLVELDTLHLGTRAYTQAPIPIGTPTRADTLVQSLSHALTRTCAYTHTCMSPREHIKDLEYFHYQKCYVCETVRE